MANIVDFSKVGTSAYPNTFVRGGAFSLDKTSLWFSLAEAENYAKTDGKAYVGQILSVFENGSTTVWKINDAEGNLVQIDAEVVVDVNVDPNDGKVYATVPVKVADPSKWTRVSDIGLGLSSIAYSNGVYVGTYDDGIWYSTDGINWTRSNKVTGNFSSITYGNGKFVASGRSGIWYSTDGLEWTQSNKTDGYFNSITYGNGKFVAGASSGIWYSTDGLEWTQSNTTDVSFFSIAYGDGKFVANGDGSIWYSTDGLEWTQSNTPDVSFSDIAYGDGKFIANGSDGIWYSTDGIDWIQSDKTDGAFTSITYGDGKFVADSNYEGIWHSDSIESTIKKQLAYQEDLEKAVLGDVAVIVDNVNKRVDALTTVVDTKAVKADVDTELAKKADKTTTETELAKKLDITTAESDYLKITDGKVTIDDAATPGDGIAKVYTIKQGETTVGTINIPKDLVVTSGSVITATAEDTGCTVGEKYIKLTIANQTAPIYIAVKDLVDVYTAAKNAAEVQLSISDSNEISATIVEKSITKDKLAESVQASLDKADAAAVKTEVDSAIETINGTLDDHKGRIEALEGATTLADAKAYTDAEIQKLDGSATIASVADGVVTIKSGITETDGVVSQGTGADITLAKVATTGKAEDISITDAEGKITATNVEGALTELAKAIDSHHTVMTTGDTAGTIKYGDEGCGDNYQEVAVAYKDGENLGEAVTRIDEKTKTYLVEDGNTYTVVSNKVADPSKWTQSSPVNVHPESITYGNGKFVVGNIDEGIWYSTDGIEWTQSNKIDGNFYSITYADGKFVAGSDFDGIGIWYSNDGIEWVQSNFDGGSIYSVTYGDSKYLAATNNGIWYSTDGIDWIQAYFNSGDTRSITYGNGKYISGVSSTGIWYSTDGINWTPSNKTEGILHSVTYSDDKFVAIVGDYSESGIWYSTDGIEWTQSDIAEGPFNTVTYHGGKYVIVGKDIWYSNDGIEWVKSAITGELKSIAYADDRFVAAGIGGIWYSDSIEDTTKKQLAYLDEVTAEIDSTKSYVDTKSTEALTEAKSYVDGVAKKIYLGTTTTNLSADGVTERILINGSTVDATTGSMAMYNGELYIWTGSKWEAASKHTTELALKADKSYVDEELAKKSDKSYVDDELAKKSDKSYVDEELAKKVDKTTTIAGVDLQDNITKEELLTALNVEDGAQVNKIEVIKVGGVALTITDKTVDIDNLILDGGSAENNIA